MKKVTIDNKEFEILRSLEEISQASSELAEKLNNKYQGEEAVWMTVMRGGLMFSTELMKHITFPIDLDFISSSSYHNYGKVGSPVINYDGGEHLKGKNIILVDDLIDSGESLEEISNFLKKFEPKSIIYVTMFAKDGRRQSSNEELVCFKESPNGFLAGFGLDIRGFYRNLPYVAIIREEDIK